MIGNGIDGPMVRTIYTALLRDRAAPRLVGLQLGKIKASDGSVLYVEMTLEAGPSDLYDAVVVPDGEEAVTALIRDAHAQDFLREQVRHGKPLMVFGAGVACSGRRASRRACPMDRPVRSGSVLRGKVWRLNDRGIQAGAGSAGLRARAIRRWARRVARRSRAPPCR
ncbi:hypothetical protein LP420_27545 [Massilia sp. B-10]|nr:hypothetical protein LP420_27545 [Massilia sp. B-10]